jgi:predicted nucleotidyltransferase component of viral defense system
VIPSRETLLELQAEHKFGARYLEIVLRLRDLLQAIGQDKTLAGSLVLKGGTALNLCFGAPPRLSVDLDFNYIGALELKKMQEDRPNQIAAIERLARRAGYRIQSSAEEHAGKRFFLQYTSALGGDGTLQVDVNFLHRIPLDAIQKLRVWDPAGNEAVVTQTVATTELVAGKVVALIDRVAPRDLYDIAIIKERREALMLGTEARAMFIAMSGVLNQPLTRYGVDRFERVTDKEVEETLHPLLHKEERPSAQQLRSAAGEILAPWLVLTAEESEYVERLQSGELRPELVFPGDSALADKLRRHPALLWKAQNAKSVSHRTRHSKK